MKNLTANSNTYRNLSALALMMLGLLLWIPQSWAATIHSTSAGGDWNKAETWVGGQVPTENDSIVVNGVVNVVDRTIAQLTVSSGAILQNHSNSWMRLTVNGDVINNGIIQNNPENPDFRMVISGNIINNGTWNNANTSLIGTQARTITGNLIQSPEIIFSGELSISNTSITFANKVSFNNQVTFPSSGNITFLGEVSNVTNIIGENLTLIYGGNESQNISNSTHNVSHVIFAGNGEKLVRDVTLNGSLTINESVTVQNHPNSWMRLTINGNVINNGTIQDNPENPDLKMVVSGNITNNGIWKNTNTSLIGTQARTISGNLIQSPEIIFSGELSISNTSITFANKVSFNNKVTFPSSGRITFLGEVFNTHNVIGENLTLIYGGNESQNISNSTHNVSYVILAGNGEKLVRDMTLNASLTINEGVTVQNHPNSWMRLTVNGDVINNGAIQDNPSKPDFRMVVSGNVTNNSVWKNSDTQLMGNLTNYGEWNSHQTTLAGEQTRILTTTTPLSGSIIFRNSFEITNSPVFTGKVDFNNQTIILGSHQTLTLLGDVQLPVTIEGEGTLLLGGENQHISGSPFNATQVVLGGSGEKTVTDITLNGSLTINEGVILQNPSSNWMRLTVNGDVINNGTIQDNPENPDFRMVISGSIVNNGAWNNSSTTLTFPSGEFRMTNTPTWEEPKRTSSYDITDYLNSQHHWQVSVDGVLSEQRGINDPNLVALPVVAVPEPTLPEPDVGATISGFVRTPDGQGVANIHLCVSGEGNCDAHTDANGYFSVNEALPNGDYTIHPVYTDESGLFIFTPIVQEFALAGTAAENLNFTATPVTDDHGDAPFSSTPVTLNSNTSGQINAMFDRDCFKVDVPSDGILTANITSDLGTYGTLVKMGSDGGEELAIEEGINFKLSKELEADSYYICLDGMSTSNQPSYQLNPVFVAVPEEPSTPDTPKICEASNPSNAPAAFNGLTGELELPQVRINTQYGNVYSINLAFQSASVTHFTFKLADFCQFENPLTIADGENTAILNDTKGIIYIPSIDVNGVSFYANLYLVKTEGWWIFKEELEDLVGEEAILDNHKEVTFKTPILEVISFAQGGPLVPLIDTLSLTNEIELSSGILMINATLDKFENPLDPEGIYWKLGKIFPKFNNELASEVVVQENLDLAIRKQIGQDDYKFTLQSYYNPNDPNGYYWRYVECPTLDKEYLSPGSLFAIDNASCRQKADMQIFITSVFPDLIHLANTYMNGIDDIAASQKFVQNAIDTVEKLYSIKGDIQKLATKNKLKVHGNLQDKSNGLLRAQIVESAKIAFGKENEHIVEGIEHTIDQVFTAIESCVPGTTNIKGCTGLVVDLTGDVAGTINNFVQSIRLNANTKKLNSVTCTLDYLTKYYGFGGNRKMLAESVGLSQDASNFAIEEVLAKTNVCNSSNMDYTLSLIERYQEQISTLNSLNSISQP